jgi:hypothetical protein
MKDYGEFVPVSYKKGIWLTAGQGILIKCGGETYIEPEEEKPKY